MCLLIIINALHGFVDQSKQYVYSAAEFKSPPSLEDDGTSLSCVSVFTQQRLAVLYCVLADCVAGRQSHVCMNT